MSNLNLPQILRLLLIAGLASFSLMCGDDGGDSGGEGEGEGEGECGADACAIGDLVCGGPDLVQRCTDTGTGCGVYTAYSFCEPGQACVMGFCQQGGDGCIDNDNDGYGEGCANPYDCDDDDPARNSGMQEICDDIDNDCNGVADDGDVCQPDCSEQECEPGAKECTPEGLLRECRPDATFCGRWTNPVNCGPDVQCIDGRCDSDDCVDSDEDGRGEGCILGDDCDDLDPMVYDGALELCDSKDNDCDSFMDEDYPELLETCTVGIGACESLGFNSCSPAGFTVQCDGFPGFPTSEVCGDSIDNDCDSETDEGFESLGQACGAGTGECAVTGTFQCEGTGLACSATLPPEACGGGDEDCDGEVDEGSVCECAEGPEEGDSDNNSTGRATPLGIGESVNARACGSRANEPDDQDRDWFALGPKETDDTFTVTLNVGEGGGRLHMELYGGGAFVDATPGATDEVSRTWTAENPGNYYIWVVFDENSPQGTDYTITQSAP